MLNLDCNNLPANALTQIKLLEQFVCMLRSKSEFGCNEKCEAGEIRGIGQILIGAKNLQIVFFS